MSSSLRAIPEPSGIRSARTLAAAAYAAPAFFEAERNAVFRRGWVCAGVIDELPEAGSWRAIEVAGTPILVVRDRGGVVRGFLNACRHRAAPLCDVGAAGSGARLRCPYHSWLYRLDGSLAKAQGVGEPDGFDPADFSLRPVGVAVWRRFVFVDLVGAANELDLGPLADAIDACPIEHMELVATESDERQFNWKVLVENYSENYHTPFIHPEIDTTSSEDYPMVADGPVLYAWDRHLRPGPSADEILRATLLPGEPGWQKIFDADTERPYDVGSYLTIWPNLMVNVFPDAMLIMWVEPISPSRTRVERRLYVAPGRDPDTVASIVGAHRLVHAQDIDICQRVQRSHDAGIDADGVLATVEERGVYFVHQHLRAALAGHAGITMC